MYFFLANLFVGLTSDIFCKGPEHHYAKETKAPEEKTKSSATPVFTKKENSTLEQRIEVLDWHHKNGQTKQRQLDILDPSPLTFKSSNC